MAPKTKGKKGSSGEQEEADRVHVCVRVRPPIRKDETFGEGSEALQYDVDRGRDSCVRVYRYASCTHACT